MQMAVKTASIAVGALAFITTFSACSSSQEAVSSSTTASAAADIDREAVGSGVRVCIVNESTRTVNVVFTRVDTARGEGDVTPGFQACGEGTRGTGNQVEGKITLASLPRVLVVSGVNFWIGYPAASLWFGWNDQDLGNETGCVTAKGVEGTKAIYDNGVLRYTVQRLADGQWKEFRVTLAEPVQPSGSLVACPDGPFPLSASR